MSWLTVIWSIGSGACLTLALIHAAVWWKDRTARANLVFSVMAIAVAAFAALELAMMRAETPEQLGIVIRWMHLPAWVIIVSLVGFVRLYLKAGRPWLAWTVVGVRTVSLILNFTFWPNINYRQIITSRHILFLGEFVSVPTGIPNPWMLVAQLSLVLLVIFVMDATIHVWRRSDRHQALVVGGSIALLVVMSTAQAVAITWGIIAMPMTVSLFYQGLVAVMAYELSYDVLHAAALARQLQATEAGLRESEKRFRIVADSAPIPIWMSGMDKLCTFFNKPWLEFTGRTMEQEMGNGWAEGVHPDDLQKCLKTYTEAFDAREPFVMQYRLRCHDGKYRWVSDNGVPRYDAQQNFAGYVGSCVDITELINKDEALRESEERMRLAADAANLGIWEWDLGKDEIWATNSRRTLLGWPASGKVGLEDFISCVHPDDRNRIRAVIDDAIRKGEDYDTEYRLVLPDGVVRWMATHGSVQFDASGKPNRVLGVSVDITELKNKEQALRESEERMSLALGAAHVGLWDWNFVKDELWGTKARRNLLGLPASGKIKLEDTLSLVHVDDRDRVREVLREAVRNGKDYHVEYRIVFADGSEHWTELRGRHARGADGEAVLRGVAIDVTERKRAEEKFRLAVEASPSGILLVNQTGQIVLVNSQIEQLFGYGREELIGHSVEILVPERFASQHPGHRGKFFAAPTARAMGAGRELFGRRKDGSEFPVEIGLNPIQTPEGTLVLAAVVDISARKLAQAETLRHREEVSHLSRVAALGELAASIAHELNQPLSGIISNASAGQRFIDRGNVDLGEFRELLGDIVADGRRAGEVIRGVRSMVKKSSKVRERINLNDLVMNVVRMIKPDATLRSCELKTLLEPNLPSIEGDPIQLQQVLLNLLTNAFDAMRETPLSRRQVVIMTERNGHDTIGASVRDYGAGIAVEVRDRLFEHFFTTKSEGMGMGLAIVRSIIESHAGKIAVENVEGGGARFHFTLPINPARGVHSAVR